MCIFCEGDHWADSCGKVVGVKERRQVFADRKLCWNCGRGSHRQQNCRSRGCMKCGARHHTSICDQHSKPDKTPAMTGYAPNNDSDPSLPPIVPVQINGQTFWAYLDTGSGRNFISSNAVKRLNLSPDHHEVRQIVTVNGMKTQTMPVFNLTIESCSGNVREEIEITGTKLSSFTTVRRPDMNKVKLQYVHTQDKRFYYEKGEEYPLHLILGDNTYSRIRTEQVYKGEPGDPIVEGTTFGWVIHGGDLVNTQCMFVGQGGAYEKLYSLDVLGVEDRGEDDQLDVYREFKDNVNREATGRYEVSVPWVPGSTLTSTNEGGSRKRLASVERKLKQNPSLEEDYRNIVKEQLEAGIVEPAPEEPTGERLFYMPHKPVVREEATTTKVRMVFDASAKEHPLSTSINECMYPGPPLQPLLWDILVRARMSSHLLLADLKKAFHQIAVREEDRDAFRFLFNLNGKEEHLRFTRVPFGAEASPFLLGATLQHHYDQQPAELAATVESLRENTYVDNLMKTGSDVKELQVFKQEATGVLEEARFPVHKWESDVRTLESGDVPNPSKILGHTWNKDEDTLEVSVPETVSEPVTKRNLSKLGSIYDPLGIISPTVVEGKHIYREACDQKKTWDAELSSNLVRDWLKWIRQLRNVSVPRSVARNAGEMKHVHLNVFADASKMACSAVAIAVIEHDSGVVKGLLTSKSRISKRNTSIPRLELVSEQMAANLARNLCKALKRLPIESVNVWMDSMVALYWIANPTRSWKVFVANCVRKIADVTAEVGISWRYCPTELNLADLGSRGATLAKMEKGGWYDGPDWLLNEEEWPVQPVLKKTQAAVDEQKPVEEAVSHVNESDPDEWDDLLMRKPFWNTLRVTAWALRFVHNSRAKRHKTKKMAKHFLSGEEILNARDYWVRRVQRDVSEDLEAAGWSLMKDENTGILKCNGRTKDYQPVYIESGLFADKLDRDAQEHNMHLGTAGTMAEVRNDWWIPHLRAKVKKVVNDCNTCKVFRVKPYGNTVTADMPKFRTEAGKPFETTGIDFAGPLHCKVSKKEQGTCYILIFTCATTRAVHLEVTNTHSAEEFQRKLNAFITRRTRPRLIISDNAKEFKATASWIQKIQRSEALQDHLARQQIKWQFNLARSPWWGGMYERLIRDIKKALYKTLGKSTLVFSQLEVVVMDIERQLNNRPLTYVESDGGDGRVLTPNVVMWGENAHTLEDTEVDEDVLIRADKQLKLKRQHA